MFNLSQYSPIFHEVCRSLIDNTVNFIILLWLHCNIHLILTVCPLACALIQQASAYSIISASISADLSLQHGSRASRSIPQTFALSGAKSTSTASTDPCSRLTEDVSTNWWETAKLVHSQCTCLTALTTNLSSVLSLTKPFSPWRTRKLSSTVKSKWSFRNWKLRSTFDLLHRQLHLTDHVQQKGTCVAALVTLSPAAVSYWQLSGGYSSGKPWNASTAERAVTYSYNVIKCSVVFAKTVMSALKEVTLQHMLPIV